MLDQLTEIIIEINLLKKKLVNLWEFKGKTDQEVLDLADQVDFLLNQYDRLLQENNKSRINC
jgi:hypothetical protein